MSDDGISDRLRRFIASHISSVAQLEILLLLHTNPHQQWTPADIARELRIEPAGAQTQLDALTASRLLEKLSSDTPSYRYNPATPDLQADTLALAQAYLLRRVTIIGLIFASPNPNIRSFSDAFRFRKDPPTPQG